MSEAHILPIIFVAIMGLAILVYSLLDGYDLGVGILFPLSQQREQNRDTMIASIGPFWDANETWLVMAVGTILIAFPKAHSVILFELYIPATIMLLGLIMRGVAFDFRAKAAVDFKLLWDRLFKLGSIVTALSQGYMLGKYVTGFQAGLIAELFSLASALGVTAAYACIGATWLIMKTEGELQKRSTYWARVTLNIMFLGIAFVCAVNIWLNPQVFSRWFDFPLAMFVLLIPLICLLLFIAANYLLRYYPLDQDRLNYLPFLLVCGIFLLSFVGLAFSYFPHIIPGQMTIWQSASDTASLKFLLYGAVVVIPVIIAYTAFSYIIFRGKASELKYY